MDYLTPNENSNQACWRPIFREVASMLAVEEEFVANGTFPWDVRAAEDIPDEELFKTGGLRV